MPNREDDYAICPNSEHETTGLPVKRPLILGEVLFDQFPDGQRVLGGAPFNVAWNLQGMGLEPLFVSAVGNDAEGREIKARMESWGMDTRALQCSMDWPTGRVSIELEGSEPHFHILDQQAYDQIQHPEFEISPLDFSLMYQGSLAYRNETSRTTIRRLMRTSDLPRFVDVNIRQPWFDREWIPQLLTDAAWIKLNDHELSWICEEDCRSHRQIADAVEKLRSRYGAVYFFITCGAAGAYAIDKDGTVEHADSPQPEPMVDTVGAGDAFSAAVIHGISRGLPFKQLLKRAVRFASRACTLQGATSRDRSHYVQTEPKD